MSKVHDRILEIVGVIDESDDSLAVSAVNFYRDRSFLEAADPYVAKYSPATAQILAPTGELTLGETLPPPTHIRFSFTFQA